VAFEAGRIMLERLRTLAEARVSFAFESTLSSRTFALFLTRCKAQGYQVHIYYVALPSAELATQRVALRVKMGGHNIPRDDITRRFQRSLHNLFALYLPLADRWRVLNNASGTLTSIAHGTARRTFVEDSDKWLNLQHLGQ
jgi:predicted ABC-type ATPase